MNEAFIGVIFLQVLFVIIIIPISFKHFKINYPFYSVKFLISDEKFEIYLYSQLFKDFLWKDITKIELINETLGLLSRSGRYLYKMKIYNINGFQEIRLYLLLFKKKQLKKIIDNIEHFSKKLDKEFIKIKEVEKGNFQKQTEESLEIQKFRINLKSKSKS